MPRKSKKFKSDSNSVNSKNARRCKNEDCISIGKENMEKWRDMKSRFNFISDQEFASYLLDLFSIEKCYISKKLSRKEIENKPPNSLVSMQDNTADQDLSVCKKHSLVEDASQMENASSVIVVNKAVMNDICEDRTCAIEEPASEALSSLVTQSFVVSGNYDRHDKTTDEQHSTTGTSLMSSLEYDTETKENLEHSINESSQAQDVFQSVKTNDNNEGGLNEKDNSDLHSVKAQSLNQKNDSQYSSHGHETKQKKQKKKKNKEMKSTFCLDENKTPQKKRKAKNSESSSGGVVKENKENTNATMKAEVSEVKPTAATVAMNYVPQPAVEDDRVAITIRLCSDCELHHLRDACPLRKPIGVISDTVSLNEWVSGKLTTGKVKSYAEASLPSCLELKVIDGKHGPSVVARQALQAFVQFGPLVGRTIKEREIPDDSTMEHIWELCDSNGCHYLTTSDASESNWLRYIRPAATRSSRNVEAVLRNNLLVFITTTTIGEGEELLFWAENTNTAWSHKKLCKTKCGGCNLSFSHTLYYRLHCAVFHDPGYSLTVRKYHCKVCGCSVLGKENIVKHAAEKHNGKGAYQCQYCSKFFLRLNYLEMHRTYGCSANPNRSRPLCDYCGRKFCQPQKLKVHIKRMHSEMLDVLRDFQCKHCLKILGSRAALQRHFKEVHQKDVVGAFTCDRCGKMFQNKSNLKIHMLTHSGIKPFKCKEAECAAAFTTKQCLQFHYRKVHGLAEDSMPPIQRSVEYTFDAYAGDRRPDSVNSDSQCSSDGEDTPEKYSNEEPSPLSPPISVTGDQASEPPLDTFGNIVGSKGSKKWIGESNHVEGSKSNVFDFDEDDKEQDINVSHIDEEPIPMLFHNCKQDSANASLLVEAALDAAERDIEMPSKITSPMSLVTNKESYPVLRSHIPHSPLGLSRPVSPVEYSIQDQSQSPHLAMESCYSTMSPRHPYSLMFPERTPHYDFRLSPPPGPIDTFHLEDSRYDHHRRTEETSSDEGVNVVQNLSIGLKNKPIQLDMPYKYDNLEERSFESAEGLDMSRTSGYHHSFVSVTPRYPPALYEPRTYSHTDVLRVVNFSHSVDLSLPRTHHQLTPPMNQSLIEPIRIISPPPPPYQTYPLSTSPPPYTRPHHSPTYHHYNTSY